MAIHTAASSQFRTTTLPCGLRIVYRHQDSPVSYCGFMMDCGTRHEQDPSQYGMAHFIEHILFKGTTHRDSWHINNRMESVGGELNAFTTKEETTFYSVFLAKDYDRAIELLCDLVCHATVPERELLNEQEVVVDEIMSYRDNPAELIYDEFENRLFANHPLGHNILGSEETVRTFHSQDCLSFIHQHYLPQRAIFFFQGKVSFEKVVERVNKYYSLSLMNEESPVTEDLRVRSEESSMSAGDNHSLANDDPIVIGTGHNQSHVLLGTTTYPIGHPDATALALINNILGGPGMNSRLNLALRERRGLVYNVESSVTNYTDAGYFSIYFGCDHKDVRRCLRICHQQLEHLRTTSLTAAQLAAAKRQLCGQLGVGSANQENSAILMAKNLLRLGHVESLDETCQRIDAVTPTLITSVMNELFTKERLMTVIIE